MTKFHINKHGVPAPCKAKPGNCPLGGDETHFNNIEDAQDFIDKKNEGEHGIIPELTKETLSKEEIEELAKSPEPADRVKAVANGYNSYSLLKDSSFEVKMAAIEKGIMLREFTNDENESVSKYAKDEYEKTTEGKMDKLHDELVPRVGKAKTKAGELVRAASRLNYRYYNDGDRIGVDYGNETCNSSARYLISEFDKTEAGRDISEQLKGVWGEDFISDKEYESKLGSIMEDVAEYVETNPHLKEEENSDNSVSDYQSEEDYNYFEDEEDDEPLY